MNTICHLNCRFKHLLCLLFFAFQISAAIAQIDSYIFGAIKNGNVQALEEALKSKPNINAVDRNGANALMWGAYYGNLEIVKNLVHHGAVACDTGVIFFSSGYYGSMQSVTSCTGKLDILQFIIDSLHLPPDENEYNYSTRKKDGWTPLSCASYYGHIEIVNYLLQKGVSVNPILRNESSVALLKAAEKEHWDIFKLLMNNGAKEKLGEHAADFMITADELEKQGPAKEETNKKIKHEQFLLELSKACFGEEHSAYTNHLSNLAILYRDIGQYGKALPLSERAIAITRKILGDEHPDYTMSLNNLAKLFHLMGQYDKAMSLFEQVLAIRKKVLGEKHTDYATSLNNLATSYRLMGQYDKALPLFEQALAIYKKVLGEEHLYYVTSLHNLAMLYREMRQYDKALPLFEQALAIHKKVLGEGHPNYSTILSNLAILYREMGQYGKALPLFQQSVAITKKVWGEEHPLYATSLNNLASLYQIIGQYDTALPLFEQALAIRKKVLGETHPDYALSLNNLAVLYRKMGQYDKALPFYEQTLAITKKVLGEEHLNYATNLINLAILYHEMGQHEKVLPLFEQSLAIRKKVLGEEHPDYASSLNELGVLYFSLGNLTEASVLFIKASNITLRHLNQTYASLSEQEKMTFLKVNASQFDLLTSLLTTQGVKQPSLVKQAYNNELTLKGMVLEDQQTVLNSIRKNADSNALNLYQQWRFDKALVGKQLLLPIARRLRYLDSLQDVTNHLEQQLSQRSVSFRKQNQAITEIDIDQKLAKGQAAIEFIRFPFFHKKWTDSIMYAAIILLPQDTIAHFVLLFDEKQLSNLLKRSAAFDYHAIDGLYGNGNRSLSDSLYHLIWKPLEEILRGIHTIYYAPAGLLHRIAFQALRTDSTHLLIDKYQMNQVLSTRSIVFPLPITSKPASAGIWGNIAYSIASNNPATKKINRGENGEDTAAYTFNFYNYDNRASRGGSWNALPGTKAEMDNIKNAFIRAGITVSSSSGALATEEVFKSLDGKSPQVLHLATHGFFFPESAGLKSAFEPGNENNFGSQQNALFRSGLVLAGGNYAWEGNPAIPGKEDGILTAYEIAQMDLSGTDLVVLSACETALGDLQGTEGVFGLQRALKLAGVKQMIVSLWKVPDQPTMELMTLFYKNWLGGQTTRQALRNAQLKIKEKYKEPFYWAAFVLVE